MKLDTMVVLAEYDSITQAELVKALLDDAGIWSMINNEYMSTIYPTGIMPAQMIVLECDLQRAKKYLAEAIVKETEAETEG